MSKPFTCLLAVFLQAFSFVQAQNYYVGTPVYEVLVSRQTSMAYVSPNCVSRQVFFDNRIALEPSGTTVYFKITASSLPLGSIYLINHGVLNAGDSVLAPVNNAYLEFYATSGSGNFTYSFIRTGIPTQVNDSFYCSSQIDYSFSYLVDGCTTVNTDYFIPWPNNPFCAVNGALTTPDFLHAEKIY
jgi:hypothetical protein